VRDRALDAVELLERHLRVLDVLLRRRVLAHLLHQALGRRDRIADLVGDRGGELLERAHVAFLEGAALGRRGALHLARDLALDVATAQVGGDQRAEEVADEPDAPGEPDDHRGLEAGDEEQEEADGAVGDRVRHEADLHVGAALRLGERALLGGQ
jgi:hypothetical protein